MKKILIPLALITGFLLTGGIITLLVFGNNSGGQGVSSVPRGENGEVDMPEIVFINLFNYFFDKPGVIQGYFINDKGEIKYFEYEPEPKLVHFLDEWGDFPTDIIPEEHINTSWNETLISSISKDENYLINILEDIYDKLEEMILTTTGYIEIDDLNNQYEEFWQLEERSKRVWLPTVKRQMESGYYGIFGVKNYYHQLEIVPLLEYEINLNTEADSSVKDISEWLKNTFPQDFWLRKN